MEVNAEKQLQEAKPALSPLAQLLGTDSVILTTVEQVLGWAPTHSFWPLTSGLA